MLLWMALIVILLTLAAPTTNGGSTATPLEITGYVVGALVIFSVAGIIYFILQKREDETPEVLYQQGSSVAPKTFTNPKAVYIVAPVPKKPTPTALLEEQSYEKPYGVPQIKIDPSESYSQ